LIGLVVSQVVITVRRRGIGASWQTKIQLDALVLRVSFKPISPSLERKSGISAVEVCNSGPGRAPRGVVELGEDHIEGGLDDRVGKTRVGKLALGSRSDQQAGLFGLQLVDEVAVVGRDVGRVRNLGHLGLEVQIEPIDRSATKGTGSILVGPLCSDGAESTNEEFSEVVGDLFRREVVVRGISSTKRKQDLLAVLLAKLDAILNGWARLEELAALAWVGGMCVVIPACIAFVLLAWTRNIYMEPSIPKLVAG
jgi:hypothetical protein